MRSLLFASSLKTVGEKRSFQNRVTVKGLSSRSGPSIRAGMRSMHPIQARRSDVSVPPGQNMPTAHTSGLVAEQVLPPAAAKKDGTGNNYLEAYQRRGEDKVPQNDARWLVRSKAEHRGDLVIVWRRNL